MAHMQGAQCIDRSRRCKRHRPTATHSTPARAHLPAATHSPATTAATPAHLPPHNSASQLARHDRAGSRRHPPKRRRPLQHPTRCSRAHCPSPPRAHPWRRTSPLEGRPSHSNVLPLDGGELAHRPLESPCTAKSSGSSLVSRGRCGSAPTSRQAAAPSATRANRPQCHATSTVASGACPCLAPLYMTSTTFPTRSWQATFMTSAVYAAATSKEAYLTMRKR